eukprot:TRINITY_DN5304_c0_g2_i1.p1 TRINITY_DN5304_c0_g2~~TRINITY_DN5304_c0_g2_i1.p1  ORF type:complete len:529 (+),score=96.65 TRINITY_DN5304_c0_g2_i1:200-1588(+)
MYFVAQINNLEVYESELSKFQKPFQTSGATENELLSEEFENIKGGFLRIATECAKLLGKQIVALVAPSLDTLVGQKAWYETKSGSAIAPIIDKMTQYIHFVGDHIKKESFVGILEKEALRSFLGVYCESLLREALKIKSKDKLTEMFDKMTLDEKCIFEALSDDDDQILPKRAINAELELLKDLREYLSPGDLWEEIFIGQLKSIGNRFSSIGMDGKLAVSRILEIKSTIFPSVLDKTLSKKIEAAVVTEIKSSAQQESAYGRSTAKETNGRLEIILENGAKLVAKDASGTSDPFVDIEFYTQEALSTAGQPFARYRSKRIDKTLDPVWDQSWTLNAAHTAELYAIKFVVWDWDMFEANDFMGEVVVKMDTIEEKLVVASSTTLTGRKEKSCKLQLILQERADKIEGVTGWITVGFTIHDEESEDENSIIRAVSDKTVTTEEEIGGAFSKYLQRKVSKVSHS